MNVLISTKPKWCELIASGKKTIEVRKTYPTKIKPPFKVYIYCTKPTYPHEDFIIKENGLCIEKAFYAGGKVIGEFVCDFFNEYRMAYDSLYYRIVDIVGFGEKAVWLATDDEMCLTQGELLEYGKGKPLYGWHISDLKIYDEPRALTDFGLDRAPQSWCYVD